MKKRESQQQFAGDCPAYKPRFQFRLRNILILTTATCVVLGWWFRTLTIEHTWPDGTIKGRYQVRRDWRGSFVGVGEQIEYYENGRPLRRWIQWSGTPGADCNDGNCTHWNENGRVEEYGHFLWLIKPVDPNLFADENVWRELIKSPRRCINNDLSRSPGYSVDPFTIRATSTTDGDPFGPDQQVHELPPCPVYRR